MGARVSASAAPPALRLGGRPGSVVAISVVTPYERLRYRIFLLVSRGQTVSDSVVAGLVEQGKYRVDFVVLAHSRDAGDRAFLARFGPATLVSDAGSIRAAPTGRIDPTEAPNPTRPGETLNGRAIYRFDFTALAAHGVPVDRLAGTLDFTDSAGVRHTIGVDLARYR